MNKQTIIDCLEAIRSDIEAGNGQQALRDLNKLEHCINLCETNIAEIAKSIGAPVFARYTDKVIGVKLSLEDLETLSGHIRQCECTGVVEDTGDFPKLLEAV